MTSILLLVLFVLLMLVVVIKVVVVVVVVVVIVVVVVVVFKLISLMYNKLNASNMLMIHNSYNTLTHNTLYTVCNISTCLQHVVYTVTQDCTV